jgi:predicted nuclease with TOPRIM domain
VEALAVLDLKGYKVARKPKKIPDEKQAKDGTVQKLRTRIKRLEKENHRLKSELNAYDQAWKKTLKYISDETKQIKLEDLIDAAKSDKNLKQTKREVREVCGKCLSDNVSKTPIPGGRHSVYCNDCEHRVVKTNGEDKEQNTFKE